MSPAHNQHGCDNHMLRAAARAAQAQLDIQATDTSIAMGCVLVLLIACALIVVALSAIAALCNLYAIWRDDP